MLFHVSAQHKDLVPALTKRLGSAFIVLQGYALACACYNVVGIEAVHHAAVEMQADGTWSLQWYACDVDVVRVWHKAGDRVPAQEGDAAAHKLNACIHAAVW